MPTNAVPLCLAAAALALCCAVSAWAAPTPKAGGFQRMRLVTLMDNEGFGQPVEVFRLLIPSDWRSEGKVFWDPQQTRCPSNIIQIRFQAVAPDGVTAFEVLPSYGWQWTDDPQGQQILRQGAANGTGCDANPVVGAADFVRGMVVPRMRRGAQAVGAEPLPKTAQAEEANSAASLQPMVQAGYLRGYKADVARVRLAYKVGQQDAEEWLNATVFMKASPTASTADLMNGNLNYSASNFIVSAYNIYGVRAPRGQLEASAPLFASIVGSVRINPRYQYAVSKFLANMGKIAMDEASNRQRIWREAMQRTQEIQQQTARQRQESQDRINEQFGQLMKGTENYVDPTTKERVELSAGYKGAWSNGKGEYILSDTPGFNPAVELKEDWKELRKEGGR